MHIDAIHGIHVETQLPMLICGDNKDNKTMPDRICIYPRRATVAIVATMAIATHGVAVAQQATPLPSVQDRPRVAYDPQGIRAGIFKIDANLGIGVEHSDNIFAASENEIDDVLTVLSPSVDMLADWGHTSLAVSGDLSVGRHNDFSNEDFDDYSVAAIARRRLGSDGLFRFGVKSSNGHDSRRVPTDEDGIRPNEYSKDSIELGLTGAVNALTVELELKSEDIDYEDAQGLNEIINNDDHDRRENEFQFRLGSSSEHLVSPFIEVNVDERNYDQPTDDSGVSRSSDGAAVGMGVRLNNYGKFNGQLLLGRISRNYDDAQRGDTDGFWSRSLLEWNATGLTTLTLRYETRIDETNVTNSAGIEVDELDFRIDHELLRNLIVSVGAQRSQENYVAAARDDDISLWTAEITYLINNRLRLSGEFESYDRESSAASQSFTENRFRIFVRAAL